MKEVKCPKCGQIIKGEPAISREDNKTEICGDCGVAEALQEFFRRDKENNNGRF